MSSCASPHALAFGYTGARTRIGIVGAGFGGSACALALAREGHRVTLLEAVETPGPVGAGIMLQPSGMAALAELGLLPRVLSHGEPCQRLRCVTRAGRVVFDLPYALWNPRLFGLGLHRGALFAALYDALPAAGVELRLGIVANAIEADRVIDARGQRHGPFDLIVVADGARSRLRASRRAHAAGQPVRQRAARSGGGLALLDALALAAALRAEPDLAPALRRYSRTRRAQLRYYQWVNRALTPVFQSHSRLLGRLRDALMPIAARLPLLRSTIVATMCGLKRGFLLPSLPPVSAAWQIPAQTERSENS